MKKILALALVMMSSSAAFAAISPQTATKKPAKPFAVCKIVGDVSADYTTYYFSKSRTPGKADLTMEINPQFRDMEGVSPFAIYEGLNFNRTSTGYSISGSLLTMGGAIELNIEPAFGESNVKVESLSAVFSCISRR